MPSLPTPSAPPKRDSRLPCLLLSGTILVAAIIPLVLVTVGIGAWYTLHSGGDHKKERLEWQSEIRSLQESRERELDAAWAELPQDAPIGKHWNYEEAIMYWSEGEPDEITSLANIYQLFWKDPGVHGIYPFIRDFSLGQTDLPHQFDPRYADTEEIRLALYEYAKESERLRELEYAISHDLAFRVWDLEAHEEDFTQIYTPTWIAVLMAFRAGMDARSGNTDAAVERMLVLHNWAELMETELHMNAMDAAYTIHNNVDQVLWTLYDSVPADVLAALPLDRIQRERRDVEPLQEMLKTCAAFHWEWVNESMFDRFFSRMHFDGFFESFSHLRSMVEEPPYKVEEELDQLFDRLDEDAEGTLSWLNSAMILYRFYWHVRMRSELPDVVEALKHHKAEIGAYPVSLDELTPNWIDELPIDPLSGGPLTYARIENGFCILSENPEDSDDYDVVWRALE